MHRRAWQFADAVAEFACDPAAVAIARNDPRFRRLFRSAADLGKLAAGLMRQKVGN
jgi:hypothetical protein